MAGKQAKILFDANIDDLLLYAEMTRQPARNRVIVLLSAKAGLRAGEIAHLTWDMVTDPTGVVGTTIELPDHAAKKGSGRKVPLHGDLRRALTELRAATQETGQVILSERGGAMTPLSVVIWFANAYRMIGLDGCSSHSGRRTFITRAARLAHHAGGSLRDVQLLAGPTWFMPPVASPGQGRTSTIFAPTSATPGDVSAVCPERDLAVLRRGRSRHLQWQSDRRRHPLRQRALPAVSAL